MLLVPLPGGWLYPAKLSAALPKYRELLRTRGTSNGGTVDESSSLFQQAKERVLLRVRERQAAARVDPRRAFARLHDRLLAARLSLRNLRNEQKERLRQYVATAVGSRAAGSGEDVAASALATPNDAVAAVAAAKGQGLKDATAQAMMGSNNLLRHLVLAGVGGACKAFLAAGAHTSVEGQERMAAALERRRGRGLITVSNHVGSIDDPLITASIVPASKLLDPPSVRWTLCATDRCFKSAALVPFFRAAKVLPVERGAGLGQFGMQLAQSRLMAGDWVHIFPEGTRSRDGRMLPVRKGVGWLVASAAAAGGEPPLVLPFVHSGMERVLPKGSSLPKLGQRLRVLVGEPVPVEDLLAAASSQGWGEHRLQAAIADRALYSLKAQLEGLPLEAVAPQPAAAALSISEDTLLPLIEDEMDSMAHRWHDRWQRLSLPSFTQRARDEAAARRAALSHDGVFGAGGTFQDIAAATEEAAGLVSSWEHAGGAAAPWAATLAPDEAAGQAPSGSELAAPAAPAEQLGLLARQKLRLLRGGVLQAAAGGLPELLAASPLDAVAARAADSRARLQGLLASATDYSAARMQHMRELLTAASPSPCAA